MLRSLGFFGLVCLSGSILAAPSILASKDTDLVTDLPGLSFTPNFKQYSGFLDGSVGNHLHYWFVEAQSSPQWAPLVLWLNGGPGCSSLLGMLTENGPFRVMQDNITVVENVNSWNKAANVLFLESPRDIGFSYRDVNQYGPDTLYNDDKTAAENALALVQFFQRFPEYQGRDFYITGESYGGVYVPTLTKAVVQLIQSGSAPFINLKGFAVGNGALSRSQLTNSAIDLLYYRGMLGTSQWENLRQCCPDSPQGPLVDCDFSKFVVFDNFGNPAVRNDTNDQQEIMCGKMVVDLSLKAVWETYNDVYNTYQDCYQFDNNPFGTGSVSEKIHQKTMRKLMQTSLSTIGANTAFNLFSNGVNPFVDQGSLINTQSTDALGLFPCYSGDSTIAYLNRKDVRQALHIPDSVQAWSDCNDDINEKYYIQQYPDMTPIFSFLIDSKYPLKVLIYNGDVDLACNFLGDQWFIENLSNKYGMKLTRPRESWNFTRPASSYIPTLAGYVKSWNYSAISIDLLTVKGAGHMVPMDRPAPALQMFYNFLYKSGYSESVPYSLDAAALRSQYQPAPQKTWTRKQADRVWNLPGASYGLNFKQYSGYLHGVTGNYLHYWFVESQGNPSTDPLVLWLTGGPGCSGLMALLVELGPFHVNSDGKTLFENAYSWNKMANVLFLESPRGVGFSVQDKSLNNDTIWDDQRTATDTYLALKDFLSAYPEYNNRPFFVTGESYGGVYVPTITSLLIDKIQSGDFPQLNLVGMSIGNGELSAIQQFNSAIMMGYFHGLYGKTDFDSLQVCCNSSKTSSQWFEYCDFSQYIHLDTSGTANPKDNSFCATKVAYLGQQIFWSSLNNVYNIYQDCYEQSSRSFGSLVEERKHMMNGFIDQGAKVSTSSTDNQGGFICFATAQAGNWLNLADVRSALHVSSAAGPWLACNDDINGAYVQQHNDTTSVFQHMLDSKYPLRVLIYNGDVDQACNYLGDQWFIEAFSTKNQIPVSKARDAWRYQTQIAGYAKKFDNQNGFTIDLLTVKGAGHLVPTDRPGPALQMMANFFRNQDYSNPSVIDTQLHPLKNTYIVAEQLAQSLNRSTTGMEYNGNRLHARGKRVVRAAKENKNQFVSGPKERAAPPPPPVGTKDQDLITNLPGLTYTPNFKQYSGYLPASQGNYLHYWLVESQFNVSTDPLILWLNGGPGCSSLGGFLQELGPFHVNSDGKTLFENQFSWNKAGNVLFLEAPRDVGFSYRSNEVPADTMYNDTYTAADTVLALTNFFNRFPEYQGRDFYITGESYGGVYVPTLTRAVINSIQAGTLKNVNLVGVAIGNGELSAIQQINSAVSLLYFRGEQDKSDWDLISKCCDTSVPQSYCDFSKYYYIDTAGNAWPKVTDNSLAGQCGALSVQQGQLNVWTTDNDVYNTFSDCYVTPSGADSKLNELSEGIKKAQQRRSKRSANVSPLLPQKLFVDQAKLINYASTDANGGFSCFSGASSEAYLNIKEVRAALHIPVEVPYWTDCNDQMNENYIQQHNDTTSVFQDIFASGYPIRFLIYNGDVDMACQFLGDQWFIESLAKANNMAVTKEHGPWNYTQGQFLSTVGGYWKQFTYTNPNAAQGIVTFDQLTVKGAGHFVPMDRPGPSLQMIYNFVNKYDYNRNLTLDYAKKTLLPEFQPQPVTVPRRKADHIFSLPGATWNINFMQHSGYLQATPGNKLFYWFVESQSGNEGDPIILWLQGGPGCASTGGLFGEIGPFFVNPDGETLFENVYSWNKAAHILVIDSPRSVGFSYQDKNVNQDLLWDDDKTAADTYLALEDFFLAYTPHRNSELYITGESYGGVYVPTLTRLLIQKIQAGSSNIKLKGMAVGNGMVSAVNDIRTLPDFLYFHGIYDRPQWEALRKCCPSSDSSYDCNYDIYVTLDAGVNVIAKQFPDNDTMQQCAYLVENLSYDRSWKALYDQYNLYQDCYAVPKGQGGFKESAGVSSRLELDKKLMQTVPQSVLKHSPMDPLSTDSNGGYECWQFAAISNYFGLSHVRDALHIPDFVQQWGFCNNLNYTNLYNDTTQVFTDILNSGYPLSVLIYNGDVDSVCSMFEAESLVNNLAISQNMISNQPRSSWIYGNQIGGYVQKFQKNNLTIDLLTVKGAGHMVPTDRPGPILQVINNFVHGQPNYNNTISVSLARQPLLPQYTEQGSGPLNSNSTNSSTTTTTTTVTQPSGPSTSTTTTTTVTPPTGSGPSVSPTTPAVPATTQSSQSISIVVSLIAVFVANFVL